MRRWLVVAYPSNYCCIALRGTQQHEDGIDGSGGDDDDDDQMRESILADSVIFLSLPEAMHHARASLYDCQGGVL